MSGRAERSDKSEKIERGENSQHVEKIGTTDRTERLDSEKSSLIRTRGIHKGALTRMDNYLKDNPDASVIQIEARYKLFSKLLDRFESVQCEIEKLVNEKDRAEEELERANFEEAYFDLDARFGMLLERSRDVSHRSLGPSAPTFKLPRISLPKFDGDITEWSAFIELFDAMLGTSEDLDDVNRLFYLKSSVTGSAAKVIESLANTGANYIEARRLLENRFGNRRCIIQSHMEGLVDTPDVKPRSVASLRNFLDTSNKHLSALRGLQLPVEGWDGLLVFLLTRKLDFETRKQFELKFADRMPTYAQLSDFLNERCAVFERIEGGKIASGRQTRPFVAAMSSKGIPHTTHSVGHCPLCSQSHSIIRCPEFLNMKPEFRYRKAKELKMCFNCLRVNHGIRECKSSGCSRCQKRHHSLLHFEAAIKNDDKDKNVTTGQEKVAEKEEPLTTASHFSTFTNERALLYTAMLTIKNRHGLGRQCRALLHNGSQACFITKTLVTKLGLRPKPVSMTVNGIGNASKMIREYVEIEIGSNICNFSMVVQALILQNITELLPQSQIEISDTQLLQGLKLADSSFNVPKRVDLLLSNTVFTRILKPGIIPIDDHKLKAVNTLLGWVVGGLITDQVGDTVRSVNLMATHDSPDSDMNYNLARFWEMDEMKTEVHDIDPCELHFRQSSERLSDGRFSIKLPFNDKVTKLASSKEFAYNRFMGLERRFRRNPDFKQKYFEYINDCMKRGFVERVPVGSLVKYDGHYLSHHGVWKDSSSTTKLRAVFDGSAAPSGGTSLNSILHTGPKLHVELFDVLIRYRCFKIPLIADIEKMFCQIKVHESDRDFLRFFWRFEGSEDVEILRLTTLPFGLCCSPFIAIRCLLELAHQYQKLEPRACELIRSSFYVDDFIGGADLEIEAGRVMSELNYVCSLGGFNLRKWSTSDKNVLARTQTDSAFQFDFDGSDTSSKILGVSWMKSSDQFAFLYNPSSLLTFSKRSLLSELAHIFDPCGWLSPITVKYKLLLQHLWILRLDWDDEIPKSHIARWVEWRDELKVLNLFRISRYMGQRDGLKLVGFADASEKAYGACVYAVNDDSVSLVAAKSRIAPLKTVSLARLELCAAVICARLMERVSLALRIPLATCLLCTDSKIVLAWISKQSYNWKTFIANRVSEIHELTGQAKWRHVATSENPADILSRGSSPKGLINCELWWKGPSWLKEADSQPKCDFEYSTELEKKLIERSVSLCSFVFLTDRYSSFQRLVRVGAWIRRFVQNCRQNYENRDFGPLSTEEISNSTFQLIKSVQEKHFSAQISALKAGKPIKNRDSLVSLNPFVDDEGVLRVGGRLHHTIVSYDTKHPIILPKREQLVDLMLKYEHERNMHIGPNGLVAIVRQRYWIINAKTQAKRIVRKCLTCFKFRPKSSVQLMGPLPHIRSEMVRAFLNTGVDLCGPFLVRPNSRRGNTTQKSFIVIFVCMAVRAVHLEVVFDLSTDSFIAALRRFVARRGVPHTIHSDNGRNFVGASNRLREWYSLLSSKSFREKLATELCHDKINWKFIPARAPHFGGVWESNIKSMKTCLMKVMQNERLSIEEFQTITTQVEAVLNSRPLGTIGNSPDERDILTPGHFLVGTCLKSIPESSSNEQNGSLSKRWFHVQQLVRHYWNRWFKLFINNCSRIPRWQKAKENIRVGDVGLLQIENMSPMSWPLCRVEDVYPGTDGLVRVVKLRTSNSSFKRSIQGFFKLPDFTDVKSPGNMDE